MTADKCQKILLPGNLVIGYGNPLRQDDGLGWLIATALTTGQQAITQLDTTQLDTTQLDKTQLDIIAAQQLTPELTSVIATHRSVLFIDADRSSGAGHQQPLRLTALMPERGRQPLSHQLTPQRLLQLNGLLNGPGPEAWQLLIPGQWFGVGNQLSPLASAAIGPALAMVTAWAQAPQRHA